MIRSSASSTTPARKVSRQADRRSRRRQVITNNGQPLKPRLLKVGTLLEQLYRKRLERGLARGNSCTNVGYSALLLDCHSASFFFVRHPPRLCLILTLRFSPCTTSRASPALCSSLFVWLLLQFPPLKPAFPMKPYAKPISSVSVVMRKPPCSSRPTAAIFPSPIRAPMFIWWKCSRLSRRPWRCRVNTGQVTALSRQDWTTACAATRCA